VNLELTFGIALALVLVGLAGFFAWRQKGSLRSLRGQGTLSPEDQRYHRNQAWRRVAGSVLMFVCAALIVAWFFLEDSLNQSAEWFALYWITVLLLVLAILCLAGFEFLAIARFGLRHHRQIQADRRAMLEDQVARLRSRRNGRH
jgi:uncharacterized membrane protein YcjF (UPF0283 family)